MCRHPMRRHPMRRHPMRRHLTRRHRTAGPDVPAPDAPAPDVPAPDAPAREGTTVWTVANGEAVAALPEGDAWDHTLRASDHDVALVRVVDGVEHVDGVALTGVTSVHVVGTAGDDRIALGVFAGSVSIHFSGNGGTDVIIGGGTDTTWSVTGSGTGVTGSIAFDGVESLVGAPDNRDTFVFTQHGVLAGAIDGGVGGFDTLVADGQWQRVQALATGPDAGALVLDATTIAYRGLEPITVTGAPDDLVIVLPDGNDDALLTQSGSTLTIAPSGVATFETHSFGVPANSLTIRGSGGIDKLNVTGAILLDGANVEFDFEEITVNGVVDTRAIVTPGNSGSITLKGEKIVVNTGGGLDASVDPVSGFQAGDIKISAENVKSLGASIVGASRRSSRAPSRRPSTSPAPPLPAATSR